MTVCHLLLRRPWLYDRNVTHKGQDNTYTFCWKDKKVVLVPHSLKPIQLDTFSTSKTIMLTISRKEIEQQLIAHQDVILLLSKQLNEDNNIVPPELQELLQEYSSIWLDELPNHLPPMRQIQHNIELILRVSIPHLSYYKMSLREHEILQQIVDDLLAKNLIHLSLIPCAVPALLVPKQDDTWCICVDNRAINNITFKYSFSTPQLKDMFDTTLNFSSDSYP